MKKLRISRNTRWSRAGKHMGESLVENIHGFYLNDNALEYLQTLTDGLNKEFKRRKKDADEKK